MICPKCGAALAESASPQPTESVITVNDVPAMIAAHASTHKENDCVAVQRTVYQFAKNIRRGDLCSSSHPVPRGWAHVSISKPYANSLAKQLIEIDVPCWWVNPSALPLVARSWLADLIATVSETFLTTTMCELRMNRHFLDSFEDLRANLLPVWVANHRDPVTCWWQEQFAMTRRREEAAQAKALTQFLDRAY